MVAALLAWSLVIAGEVTGVARHLGHDAVLEGGFEAPVGTALFLGGWLVMVAAMMLPTLAARGRVRGGTGSAEADARGAFLGGFALVWAVVGLAALGGDMVVHRVVHGVPSLEARPWMVVAGVFGLAGTIQLMPSTRRSLAAARRAADAAESAPSTFLAGQRHGWRCLRSDGPLMLVMFAIGSGVAWMVVLTAVMAGERSSSFGQRLAAATGVALLAAAAAVALNQEI